MAGLSWKGLSQGFIYTSIFSHSPAESSLLRPLENKILKQGVLFVSHTPITEKEPN